MDKRAGPGAASHLSVSQFAVREGVSRIRVLQLLAAHRIPGARKIGHQWVIPASAAMVRRSPGRPAKQASAGNRLLRTLARRYVWWLSPEAALARPNFIATSLPTTAPSGAATLRNGVGRHKRIVSFGRLGFG